MARNLSVTEMVVQYSILIIMMIIINLDFCCAVSLTETAA